MEEVNSKREKQAHEKRKIQTETRILRPRSDREEKVGVVRTGDNSLCKQRSQEAQCELLSLPQYPGDQGYGGEDSQANGRSFGDDSGETNKNSKKLISQVELLEERTNSFFDEVESSASKTLDTLQRQLQEQEKFVLEVQQKRNEFLLERENLKKELRLLLKDSSASTPTDSE